MIKGRGATPEGKEKSEGEERNEKEGRRDQDPPKFHDRLPPLASFVHCTQAAEPALGMCEVCGRTGPPILRGPPNFG